MLSEVILHLCCWYFICYWNQIGITHLTVLLVQINHKYQDHNIQSAASGLWNHETWWFHATSEEHAATTFNPEDRGNLLLQNVSNQLHNWRLTATEPQNLTQTKSVEIFNLRKKTQIIWDMTLCLDWCLTAWTMIPCVHWCFILSGTSGHVFDDV